MIAIHAFPAHRLDRLAGTLRELVRLDWPDTSVVLTLVDPKLRFLTVVATHETEHQSVTKIRLYPAPSFKEIDSWPQAQTGPSEQ